jgi:DNA-directed RNA polymerase subunit RPC12/RpoP
MSDRYSVGYRCKNCYRCYLVYLPRGMEAPTYYDCPNCGRAALFKTDTRKVIDNDGEYESDGVTLRKAAR